MNVTTQPLSEFIDNDGWIYPHAISVRHKYIHDNEDWTLLVCPNNLNKMIVALKQYRMTLNQIFTSGSGKTIRKHHNLLNSITIKLYSTEYFFISHLVVCDAAIGIQRVWRYRLHQRRLAIDECWEDFHKTRNAIIKIQSIWRRFIRRHDLALMKAMHEIDLRLCRARYKSVINASKVIHRAWADYKLRKRINNMSLIESTKLYILNLGIPTIF